MTDRSCSNSLARQCYVSSGKQTQTPVFESHVGIENDRFTMTGSGPAQEKTSSGHKGVFVFAGALAKSVIWPLSLYVQWECGFDCAIQVENNLVDRWMANDNYCERERDTARAYTTPTLHAVCLITEPPTHMLTTCAPYTHTRCCMSTCSC